MTEPDRDKTHKQWLEMMRSWTGRQLRDVCRDEEAPAAQIAAAQQHRTTMESGGGDPRQATVVGQAFDRVTNRLEGRPASNDPVPDVKVQILNIGSNDVFRQIDNFLSAESTKGAPFVLRAGSDPEKS